MRVFVTGGAGFIGSHLCERLLRMGHDPIIVDNFNDFYDPGLKRRNMEAVAAVAAELSRSFTLCEGDIRDQEFIGALFAQEKPAAVVHLAAAAGVRPSIENPLLYEEVNVRGTMNLLEAARAHDVRPFVFASSSSVYGNNEKVPFAEDDPVDHPISPYAATKKSGELICHTYHHLYGTSIACLRFFTVYGPRQRPDLAISKFSRLMLQGKPIQLFGDGSTSRDYTYITDIVDGITKALAWVQEPGSRYGIFNLGGSNPVTLKRLVEILEQATGLTAHIERLPMQPGDVERTFADTARSEQVLGFRSGVSIEEGIREYVGWYRKNMSAG